MSSVAVNVDKVLNNKKCVEKYKSILSQVKPGLNLNVSLRSARNKRKKFSGTINGVYGSFFTILTPRGYRMTINLYFAGNGSEICPSETLPQFEA